MGLYSNDGVEYVRSYVGPRDLELGNSNGGFGIYFPNNIVSPTRYYNRGSRWVIYVDIGCFHYFIYCRI